MLSTLWNNHPEAVLNVLFWGGLVAGALVLRWRRKIEREAQDRLRDEVARHTLTHTLDPRNLQN